MSKTWYPVVDLDKCIGCGVCSSFCSHGVYTVDNDKPVVVNPEGCVHGCRGCQNKCSVGAIEYMGKEDGEKPCCCKDSNSNCC